MNNGFELLIHISIKLYTKKITQVLKIIIMKYINNDKKVIQKSFCVVWRIRRKENHALGIFKGIVAIIASCDHNAKL